MLHNRHKVQLIVLKNFCAVVIIGHDILNLHSNVKFSFGGTRSSLMCALTTMKAPYPVLFNNLSPNYKPISTKSRRYLETDSKFIQSEVKQMLAEGIVEPSLRRVQVVVTHSKIKGNAL